MTHYADLIARIRGGEKVLIDGATGSEMERRGIPEHTNGWYGAAALTHPDILRSVHAEYIEMGAELVVSNTFATHRSVLRDAGAEEDFEPLNRLSVELAREARDGGDRPHVVVGASVSHWSFSGDDPSLDDLEQWAREQMRIMTDAGAELLVLEMMVSIDRMHRLLAAARETELPIWVGLSVGDEEGMLPDPAVMTLREFDEPLGEAIDSLQAAGVDLLSIMHTDVDLVDACLDVAVDRWDGPLGVYAHSWRGIDPADYAARAKGWLDRGVSVIGGCCGTLPEHVAALSENPSLTIR